jgi:hypothetical protein
VAKYSNQVLSKHSWLELTLLLRAGFSVEHCLSERETREIRENDTFAEEGEWRAVSLACCLFLFGPARETRARFGPNTATQS